MNFTTSFSQTWLRLARVALGVGSLHIEDQILLRARSQTAVILFALYGLKLAAVRASMEPRFGHDFNKMRVQTNTEAVKSTRAAYEGLRR